jgi:hypothetical protein
MLRVVVGILIAEAVGLLVLGAAAVFAALNRVEDRRLQEEGDEDEFGCAG